jgi:hypothetical protein
MAQYIDYLQCLSTTSREVDAALESVQSALSYQKGTATLFPGQGDELKEAIEKLNELKGFIQGKGPAYHGNFQG